MFVLPVNETRASLLSWMRSSPMDLPGPQMRLKTAGGTPSSFRTLSTILVMAILQREVVVAPFHIWAFPQIRLSAAFHPHTAMGKLKAVITPMRPRGFQFSSIKCSGLSEGKTCPPMVLDMPWAMSQMSMNSCTSPFPSTRILPISSETSLPRGSKYFLISCPIALTTSPLLGIGVFCHSTIASCMLLMQRS